MIRKKKKTYKMRGSRSCGGGCAKKRKGAGHRGGRGNAGSGKEKKQKYTWFLKYEPDHLGKHGFKRLPELRKSKSAVNLRYLNDNLERLLEKGVAFKEKNNIIIDVSKLGVSNVLGEGKITKKFSVKADEFSEKAKIKIEKAGEKAITGGVNV